MSKAKDEEVVAPGVVPRERFTRPYGTMGKKKYPFSGMLVGDYLLLDTWSEAVAVRAALRSFYKRNPGRRFTVRQSEEKECWVCRRVL